MSTMVQINFVCKDANVTKPFEYISPDQFELFKAVGTALAHQFSQEIIAVDSEGKVVGIFGPRSKSLERFTRVFNMNEREV